MQAITNNVLSQKERALHRIIDETQIHYRVLPRLVII